MFCDERSVMDYLIPQDLTQGIKHFMKSKTQNPAPHGHPSHKNVRIHHHRLDKEYSIIANHGVENSKLSWGAKGLLWYMISRESTFEIHSWHLSRVYKGETRGNGIEATRSMLDELKNEGYLVHHKYQDSQGRWNHRYDVFPMPIDDFQKMFPGRVKPCTVRADVLPITDLPITPPLTPPHASPPEKKAPNKSLRSEEEDSHKKIENTEPYKILDKTNLSPKDKKRLTKDYTEPEVARAVKIAATQTPKKSLMSLLINILDNPDKWNDDASGTQLKPQGDHIAVEYNERLRKIRKLAYEPLIKPGAKVHESKKYSAIAEENDRTIPEGYMTIVIDGFLTKISLKSSNFTEDIKDATSQLG